MSNRYHYKMVPSTIRRLLQSTRVIEVEAVDGPGFVYRRRKKFKKPIDIKSALLWVNNSGLKKGARLFLDNDTVLWFVFGEFSSWKRAETLVPEDEGVVIPTTEGNKIIFSVEG